MDKYIGRLLDNRYEILEVIGTGGMAVVYKARCHRLNRLVAIKILKDDYLEDEEFRRRFHSESQAVAMFSHPNIVSVYDVSTSITADYIVMELIDGITLKQYMEKKGILNWKETLHFAMQIAKALEHAHSRGIVHRDIKPHNVMVLKNGSVKVTDFGIARMMSKGNTLTKEALGSVHYISPEQAKGGRVDNRSDIYSLGVVMYEMMSGRPPYDGESPVSVAIQHINGGAVMPSLLNPNIPGGLEQIIMKAMAHEPGDRYATAAAMLADLDEFRKNPAILFDYNTPPTDAVTAMPKPPLVLEPQVQPPVTTAERVERKAEGEKRVAPAAATPPRRRPADSRQAAARRREEEQKRNKVALVAIIACSVVMLIAIGIILAVALNGGVTTQTIEVPDLVGQVYDTLPEYADFEIKRVDEVYSDEYEEGKITEQKPAAGEQVTKGEKIYVIVSLGPANAKIPMPDLVEWELEQAKIALNNLKLNITVKEVTEVSETIPAGSVIRTDPEAEKELSADQTVTLYVSAGKEIRTSSMPEVVGYDRDKAKKILEDQELDLDIVIEEIFDSEVEVGKVVRSSPEEGVEIKTAQRVTLYVSKGPELKTLPDILERNIADAVSMLATAGFTVYETEPVPNKQEKDTVVQILVNGIPVDPGEELDVNTKLTLTVSKGKNANEVTKDVTLSLDGVTAAGPVKVTIKRLDTDEIVFDSTVAQGENSVTLRAQTGSGTVIYEILLDDMDASYEKVSF